MLKKIPKLWVALANTNVTWNNNYAEYNDKACRATFSGRCYFPRGKMISGSGGLNGMLYIRGNRRDYDRWEEAGNTGWGWDNVLPYFERSVTPAGSVDDPKGYVVLNKFPIFTPDVIEKILQGAAELGVPTVSELNATSDVGFTRVPATYQDGVRMSTGSTYLAKVSQRPNLHVIKNSQVTKLNFDESGKTVRSVSFVLRDEYEMEVAISKEVVVSAGAIGSPQLLLLSGVGPAQHLDELEIPLVHDLPVGENLQDHIMVTTFTKLNPNTAPSVTNTDYLDSIYNFLIDRRPPLSTPNSFGIVGLINTLKDSPYPDVEYHHFYFRRGDFNNMQLFVNNYGYFDTLRDQIFSALAEADVLVVLNALLNTTSSGNIRLNSTNYNDPPKITYNYLSDPEEQATLLRAVQFQEQLLGTEAYKAMNASILRPKFDGCDADKQTHDDYWLCYFKYLTASQHHFGGTVKMAPATDKTSCVNPRLQLNGSDNVRVVDASIMPEILSGNLMADIIMIAEKAMDFIGEDWQD